MREVDPPDPRVNQRFYREAGDRARPTIVLLHGYPSSSHTYRELIPLLSGTLHVVAPDHLGSGLSDRPDPERIRYTFDLLADHVPDVAVIHMGTEDLASSDSPAEAATDEIIENIDKDPKDRALVMAIVAMARTANPTATAEPATSWASRWTGCRWPASCSAGTRAAIR